MDKVFEVRDRAVCDGCHGGRVEEEGDLTKVWTRKEKSRKLHTNDAPREEKRIGRAEGSFLKRRC